MAELTINKQSNDYNTDDDTDIDEELDRKWMQQDMLEYEQNREKYEQFAKENNLLTPLKKEIIAISYFYYTELKTGMEIFHDENSAKEWLYDRWGWLLKEESTRFCGCNLLLGHRCMSKKIEEIPETLDQLIKLLSERFLHVEMIRKSI